MWTKHIAHIKNSCRKRKKTESRNPGKMRHQNMQHFVDKHLLIPLYLDPGEELYCKACELLIVEPFHGCLACKNYLHHHCLNVSRSIIHPSHPDHPLALFSSPTYPSGSCSCNACGETVIGFTYSCAHCEFDLHLKCARLPMELTLVDKHPHDLKLEFKFDIAKNAIFTCDVCDVAVGKDTWRYYCEGCDFGVHVGCVKEVVTGGLVEAVAEGKSGTALLYTQPPSGEVSDQAAAAVGGSGGGGTNDPMDSFRQLSNEMIQQQFELARIQNQVNLSAAVANIGVFRRYY